jgi:seryl-tRNA synthetase
MLDIKTIKEDPERTKKAISSKGYDPALVDQVLKKYDIFLNALQKFENLSAQKNKYAKEKNIKKGKETKSLLQHSKKDLSQAQEEFESALFQIPNLPSNDTPEGKDESQNKVLSSWGDKPEFNFKPKDHLELAKALDLIDFERGAKVTGSQFYFLKGDLVLLEQALINFGIDLLSKEGYKLITTPDLAKSRYYLGTGYLPKGQEAQIYEIKDKDMGLIATSEVTMAGFHADEVLSSQNLPLKYAALSHCFRQESGAYGKYSKGLFRVHQFTKLEMFIFSLPQDSDNLHKEILSLEEKIYQALKIPYQVVQMCTGDLGAIASKKYDINAWMPGRGEYEEITSTSNTTDYQSRNLNIKFQAEDKNEYVHLLNGTAIATSRTLIAILENNQQKDGSIKIPKALQKYIGKEKITK